MGNYAIVRTAKLTSVGHVGKALNHNTRGNEKFAQNADPMKKGQNLHYINGEFKNVNNTTALNKIAYKNYVDSLPDKIRSNAVHGIEYMIAYSPEAKLNEMEYFKDAQKWLEEKHGAENVILTSVHLDETTPHMHAIVTPNVINEKGVKGLNARHFLGGSKKLSEMQTDFANKVGKKYGLERGEEKSQATHKTIKNYYENVKKNEADFSKEEKQFSELIKKDVEESEKKKLFESSKAFEDRKELLKAQKEAHFWKHMYQDMKENYHDKITGKPPTFSISSEERLIEKLRPTLKKIDTSLNPKNTGLAIVAIGRLVDQVHKDQTAENLKQKEIERAERARILEVQKQEQLKAEALSELRAKELEKMVEERKEPIEPKQEKTKEIDDGWEMEM
jgi:hypothetical protein